MVETATSLYTVDIWTRALSIDFLAARLDWSGADCDAVANDLCDLASALRIVNSIAIESGWSADEARRRIAASRPASEPDRIVAAGQAAIDIAARHLAESTNANLAQWHFMNLATLAYLPQLIPVSLLPAAALTLDSPALGPFFKLGILAAKSDAISIDPILQHAVRTRLRAESNNYGFVIALTAVERGSSDTLPIESVFAILGHAEAGVDTIPPQSLEKAAKLAQRLSRSTQGEDAQQLHRLGIAIEHRRYGDEDRIGIAYSNFGDVLKKSGNLAGAYDAYRRALEIGEACYGPDHAKVGLRLAKVGGGLKQLKNYPAAQTAYERSIAIGEATLEQPETTATLAEVVDPQPSTVLADVYGDNTQELVDDLRAYAAYLQTVNESVQTTSRCLFLADSLATEGFVVDIDQVDEVAELLSGHTMFLRRQEFLSDARRVYERVIAIRERLPDNIEHKLGRTLAAYAILLQQIGDVAATQAAAERLRQLTPPKPAPSTRVPLTSPINTTKADALANRYENLGKIKKELGDLKGACAAFERSIELTTSALKLGKELTGRIDLLAATLRQRGSIDAACAAYERAVAIADRTDPSGAPQANRLEILAGLRKQSGDIDGAIDALRKAVAVDDVGGRTNTKAGAVRLNNLARSLESMGDLGQAEVIYERALRAASYDSSDLPLRTVLTNFALMLRRKGDLDTAIWYAKRAVDIDRSTIASPDAGVANRLANMGVVLFDRGEYIQASAAFEEARRIRVELFGEEDASAHNLQEWLVKAREMMVTRTAVS
jgi:tetratricopeptide (TPR) repeat protein